MIALRVSLFLLIGWPNIKTSIARLDIVFPAIDLVTNSLCLPVLSAR